MLWKCCGYIISKKKNCGVEIEGKKWQITSSFFPSISTPQFFLEMICPQYFYNIFTKNLSNKLLLIVIIEAKK